MNLTLQQAARATNAQVLNEAAFPPELRIVTDTRAIEPGDTFLALHGERFDGHTYVRDAIAKGAAAVVVDRADVVDGAPALLVADTKRAYMDLAGAARRAFHGHVIGITGSAGKTTTKHLLAQLLAAHYGTGDVLASPANENNEIGVSKLLLAAQPHHSVLVIEMGARHEGDIAALVQIARPHAGVLTNIGEAHLEIFGSRERLARTKWALFSLGAQAILNACDSESVMRAAALATPPLWFGAGSPNMPGVWIENERTLTLTYGTKPASYAVDVRLPGAHNRANLAAAMAAALVLGIPVEELIAAIPQLTLPAGRYEAIEVSGGARIIYDAYNANATGMIAALDAFANERAARRIAVLASMAELGTDAPAMHERVGAHAASVNVDILLCGGEYASSLAAGAVAAGFPRDRIVMFGTNDDAVHWLREHAGSRDVVLLKGSRKYKMEEIVEALRLTQGGIA
jgi:UDP-N-acetylmuramoyl-tripeptide--D-alanyl-D-alanine ligase